MKRLLILLVLIGAAAWGWHSYNGGWMPSSGENVSASAQQGGARGGRRARFGGGEVNVVVTDAVADDDAAARERADDRGVDRRPLDEQGIGIALKIEDGAARAREVALAALIRSTQALTEAQLARVPQLLTTPLLNRAGTRVGEVRPAAGWPG